MSSPCDTTREQLLTGDPSVFDTLPHLETCADCRALADALRARHSDLDRALDTWATAAAPPDPAETPDPPRRWMMTTSTLLLAAAAVATLTLGIQNASTRPGSTPASEPCAITEDLEVAALEGELSPEAVDCLESKGGGSEKANRLLMVNAFAAGDMARWRTYAAEEMQRARRDGGIDVDIVYKLALYDAKTEDWDSVVQLTAEGLARVGDWPEEVREQRELNLLKIRALAGMKLQLANPDDPAAAERARAWTEAWEARKR